MATASVTLPAPWSTAPALARLAESARAVAARLGRERLPERLVVLGSGFKGFESRLTGATTVALAELPNFPVPQVEGHGTSLVVGACAGHEVAVLTGRVHLYEGHTATDVVHAVRVCAALGTRSLLLTNAAGSVDFSYRPGDVVLVTDHMNLTGQSCLAAPEARALGPIFLDMGVCYDEPWRDAITSLGGVRPGVYAGALGPAYETPAETVMLGRLGANVVGMSTVQEALAARQLGLRVACLSLVTNMAGGLGHGLSHEEVLELGRANRARLADLLEQACGVAR